MDIDKFLQSGALLSLNQDRALVGYGSFYRQTTRQALDSSFPSFYFPDFFLQDAQPWIQFEEWQEVSVQELADCFTSYDSLSTLEWINASYPLFKAAFHSLQKTFKQSALQKAVPYAFACCQERMTPARLENSLKAALDYQRRYPGYLYGCWDKKGGLLGVTPELLFKRIEQHKLKTVALAGTCPASVSLSAFKNDLKERHEHRLVVEGIKSSLEPFGTVAVGPCEALSLPLFNHLMTTIDVDLSIPIDFQTIVEALHPTPALGTFPKEQGKEWLKNYDRQLNRQRYGAPAGCWHPKKNILQSVVAIRNAQWDETGMRIGAGCGVVSASDCEKEWNEINLKLRAIQRLLAL